jgi:CBS-domain-containing membrane protein
MTRNILRGVVIAALLGGMYFIFAGLLVSGTLVAAGVALLAACLVASRALWPPRSQ